MNVWDADIAIDAPLAARLIARQFPALAPVSVESFGVGWDNVAFRVNDSLVFRFPRRQIAVELLKTEARWLPTLAPHLPLPIPDPQFLGMPEDDYPYPFVGYPLLAGTTADRVPWTDEKRANCAVPLAEFLRALHALPIDGTTRALAPGDTLGRADIAKRAAALRERLARLVPIAPEVDFDALNTLIDRLLQTPPFDISDICWVHGDLYARHLLVDDAHHPCGVIDWGDLHIGDRALDLSIAFSFLPAQVRPAFRAAYGAIDDATWDRARFRALHYGAILTLYGVDVGDAPIEAAGRYALTNAGDISGA